MKNNHEIILKQYAAYCKEQPLYLGTAGSYGMEMLTIIREGVWAEYDILAAFHPPVGAAVQVRVGANNQIGVPIEATAEKGMGEIVFAGYKEGVRQIAVDVLYKVAPSSGASGTEPAEPTPDVVQQLLAAASNAEEIAQSVRDDADAGKFTGAKGDKGDIGPTGPKGEQGPKGERGEKGDPGKDAVIDTTLSRAGEAADAAEVGKLKEDIGNIATVDENLFNPNGTRHLNSNIDYHGNIVVGDDIVYELPIKGGTYVSNMPTIGVYKIACISKDGTATIVTPSTTSDLEEHFTLPDGTTKAYMSFWSGRDSEVESADYTIFKKGMIVSGNTLPSEYIPYYKNLNDDVKVNESNIRDGTKLNKYIDTEALSEKVSDTLFNETSNLIDSGSYLRGTLLTSGVVAEISDSTASYIYTIKIPDATLIGMNAVPQVICFYDENMGFLESKQLADTSDDTISVNIPTKSKYAKLSYWYGRGVDGSFEHVAHLKDISVTVDSVPFQKIDKQTILSQDKKYLQIIYAMGLS